MITTVAIAELLEHGVTIQPHEAVAVAQAVAAAAGDDRRVVRPPFGPPTPSTVHLDRDGSVMYTGSDGAPAVSEVAILLQTMLASAVKVPGALRYTIARALLDVDAPPFDSLADFSRALARFEQGDRRAAVRSLLGRDAIDGRARSITPPDNASQKSGFAPKVTVQLRPHPLALLPRTARPPSDRRRVGPQVTELRRHLRDADQRLFEQQIARRKTARIVKMPALSVVSAPPATQAIEATTANLAVETAARAPETEATRAMPVVSALGLEPAAVLSDGRTSWLRGPAAAFSAAAALVIAAAAGFVHVRHMAPPTGASDGPTRTSLTAGAISSRQQSELPATRTASTDSDRARRDDAAPAAAGGPRPSIAPTTTGDATSRLNVESSVRSASPGARPTRADIAHPVLTSAGGNRRAVTDPGAEASVADDRVAGVMVSALDRQQRPVFSPAFASTESAIFLHPDRASDARSALEMATPADGAGDLHVIAIQDDGARNYHVQPSPDGQLIAFDSDRDGERGVYIANRDGSDVRRVSGSGYAAVPSWAPDGKRLAYVRAEPDNPKVWNLWLLSLDPRKIDTAGAAPAERLTHYVSGQSWAASWFSDGRRICYTHEDKIVVLDLASGRPREFESPIKGGLVRTPAVSPDGTKVIFQVFRHGAWLLDLGNGSMRRVLTDPSAEQFAWAPNGRRIAFHSRRNREWGIYVYPGS